MIQRMLITDVIKQLDERKNLNRKINDLKKELGEHSTEYKAQVKELKDKASKSIYLEEDCHLITGNGLKKGREIVLEEAKRLLTLGFYVLWISDEAISDKHKKENFLYNYKTELENVLSKTMVILDETNARKPGSTIKYIEKNDLLKQTIEAIQLDGAKYLAKSIFGESAKRIDSVKTLINTYFRKGPDKVDLFDHTCLGNLFKKKKKDDSQSDKSDKKEQEDEDRTNFYLRFMINIGICFMTVVSNLQKIRLERDPNDRSDMNRRLDPEKRHGFSDEELIEGSLAAIFAEYGYLHVAIDELLKRFTTPYYNNEGVVDESGFARLSEKNQLVYDKHCNVSYHFFASMKDQGFVGDLARDILQYHHRGLNDSGYPRRKMVDEKVQQKDLDGNISIISQNVYEYKVSEMSRLVSIINFFVEYFFHTPLHIPFQRDNLVRFILLNSVYPPGKDNKPDKDGIYDIQTQYTQPKRFDAYLVDVFLKSINIYKINERIPIYNFNNTQKKLYDAIVVKYNEMPHRPVVKIKDEKGEREIDLSSKDNESLYIGEYIPSLRFQEVIDNFHIDKVEGGIKLSDNIEDDSMIQMKKEDRQTAAMLDDIFDDGQQIVVSADDTPNIDIDHLLSDLPPELAKAKAKKEEEPIKEEIKEDERISELDILTKTDEIPIVDEVIFDEKEDKLEESHFDDSDVLFEPPVDISNSMESSAKEETKSGDVIDTDELLKTFSEEPIDFDHEPELNIEKPKEKIESKMDIPEDDYKQTDEPDIILTEENIDNLFETDFEKTGDVSYESASQGEFNQINKDSLYSIVLKKENEIIPYGLGKLVSSTNYEKKFKINYLSHYVEESLDYYTYQYSLLDNKNQQVITVYNPSEYNDLPIGTPKYVVEGEFEDGMFRKRIYKAMQLGAYHLLYYVEELDRKKYKNPPKNAEKLRGIPKYIVQIKRETDQRSKPIVTFVRYILISGNEVQYVKDKNCGNDFDLRNLQFFRVDRSLSAKEIVKFLDLTLV